MPRIVETPGGLVNAIGFDNPGLEHFLATELPWLVAQGATVVVSMAGASMGEYADLARRLGRAPGLAAVEVNLSAPDALGGGVFDVREPFQAAGVVSAVRRDLPRDLPVIAKLRTDVFRVVETAQDRRRGRRRCRRDRQRPARRAARRPAGRSQRTCCASAGAALRRRRPRRAARPAGGGRRRDRHRRPTPARSWPPEPGRSRSEPPCCTTPRRPNASSTTWSRRPPSKEPPRDRPVRHPPARRPA